MLKRKVIEAAEPTYLQMRKGKQMLKLLPAKLAADAKAKSRCRNCCQSQLAAETKAKADDAAERAKLAADAELRGRRIR
jgi:hypothetical protein